MTVCNMSVEAGARAGMIAPDETTFGYLAGRPRVPAGERFGRAVEHWRGLRTDTGARFDARVALDAGTVAPQVTWGTSPGMVTDITGRVPDPDGFSAEAAFVPHRLRVQVDQEIVATAGARVAREQLPHLTRREPHREQPVLAAVRLEDVGERRRQHGAEAVLPERPHGMLA